MGRRKGGAKDELIAGLARGGKTITEMMAATGYSYGGVSLVLKRVGIKPVRQRKQGTFDKAAVRRSKTAANGARLVQDNRRFKVNPVPLGDVKTALKSTDPAAKKGRTVFADRVFEPGPGDSVLIDGLNNAKIGGDVLTGDLKGARIFTLTLEERATCPRSCQHWLTCYGNGMHWPRRWKAGAALEAALEREVAELCTAHEKVLIRLHILGDFYSSGYIRLWQILMDRHKNLHVFGFTARPSDDALANALYWLDKDFPDRWHMRRSGTCGKMGSFTIDFPTAKKTIGDALVCPEQRDAMEGSPRGKHCGSCAACWQTDAAIVFVEH